MTLLSLRPHQNLSSELADMERSCSRLDAALSCVEPLGHADTFQVRSGQPVACAVNHREHCAWAVFVCIFGMYPVPHCGDSMLNASGLRLTNVMSYLACRVQSTMNSFRAAAAQSVTNAKTLLGIVETDFRDLCSYLIGNAKK